MNAVEIEEAISELAAQDFDAAEFPFAFLEAFGNKATTIKQLRKGTSNSSDVGGVLQRNNIHILVCDTGSVTASLDSLRESAATTKAKAKFILATDGVDFEAEDLNSGETVACSYEEFPDHFGFFLALAGISTVKQIRNSAIDIKATGRLNRLYIELLKQNPEWSTPDRRHDMNQFMARLIFCFFAEDTDIFNGDDLFTATIEQMSDARSENTHEVISEIFRAMDVKPSERAAGKFRPWADAFPYVNGGLFAGTREVPQFSRIARKYLLHAGRLDWQQINPDIFGSMIQAVADDEERGSLGMHYTSVENILKLLNPLFLDDLHQQLDDAADNERKLLNLRKRMAKIRVFDPACGSGNFLVIAYKQMREIEYEINHRRGETHLKSEIPLTNFRGIELRDFPAEIARLALIIAEFQCDVVYRGQKDALAEFLPLNAMNWITCGNALRLDWLSICQPTGTKVKLRGDDLFNTPLEQSEIDFENEGGETYICGNPPYKGTKNQLPEQKEDMKRLFDGRVQNWKSLDYVAGWFIKAADYSQHTNAASAFVSTNSICQGNQVPVLWPQISAASLEISFAYTSFKWANLAAHNAGVIVVIVGMQTRTSSPKRLFSTDRQGVVTEKKTSNINAYLVAGMEVIVEKRPSPAPDLSKMVLGNQPYEGSFLMLTPEDLEILDLSAADEKKYVRRVYGSSEFIRGGKRHCIWIPETDPTDAMKIAAIADRIEKVRTWREESTRPATRALASRSHQFCEMNIGAKQSLIVPIRSSERREYLPVGLLDNQSVITNLAYALYDAPLFNLAIIASRLQLIWVAAVCGRMKTDYSYSNKMGWNTFPVPRLTEKNKADLEQCAADILTAREAHFPATLADLYDPDSMPENLRRAHERNDEILERIYIGRRFKNDTERLEKLFELYTKTTKSGAAV